MRTYEMPWRPAYEAVAAGAWTAATVLMALTAVFTALPSAPFWSMGGLALGFAVLRWWQTLALWRFKISLAGRASGSIEPSCLLQLMRREPEAVWLGYGFEWTPVHAQRAMEMRKRVVGEFLPPGWFLKLLGIRIESQGAVGAQWIHGLEPRESSLYLPLPSLEGNTAVFGTTGSGKTRLFEPLIYQAVQRGSVVIVIDPKGDAEMRDLTRRACDRANRKDAFLYFHPAFPSHSVRIDPLKNWNRETEVASRIAALMPSSSADDAFVQFAWRALHLVTAGLIYIDERPTLMKLRRFIEAGPDELMERVLVAFFGRHVPEWRTLTAPLVQRARDERSPRRPSSAATPELQAYAQYYQTEIPAALRDPAVDGLLAMTLHNREHLSKTIASLQPLLVMLTSGDLGPLLSPDASDIGDERPIYDLASIIDGGKVFYAGLDSLSDATVGAAIGSMLLADLASVAGAIYNFGRREARIEVFLDEAASCLNRPLVEVLNKGRGAGFIVTLASQTLPDYIAALGSEHRARMVLGNCNNLIALRTKDLVTQKFIVETFGDTHVQQVVRSQGTGNRSDDGGMHVTAHISESLSEQRTAIFPPELLGMLPNLQYIASVSGGKLIKGRLPRLEES